MRSDGGFTIVEALVAFAILAVVMLALYQAGGTSILLAKRANRLDEATALARSKLAELDATRTPLAPHESGSFEGSDMTWEITTRDQVIAGLSPEYRAQTLVLRVSWPTASNRASLVVESRHLGRVVPS